MKFHCLKEDFQKLISNISKVSSKNSISDIYNNCFFNIKNNFLNATIQNIETGLGIIIKIPIESKNEFKFFTKINTLKNIFSNLTQQNIEKIFFEIIDNNLLIKYSDTEIKILLNNSNIEEDFISLEKPQEKNNKFIINIEKFITAVKCVKHAAFRKNFREDLCSVYIFSKQKNIFFVSTDTLRLAEKKINLNSLKEDFDFIIPLNNIKSIIEILENYKEKEILINIFSDQISFEVSNIFIISKIINSNFPDYNQIIPKDFKTKLVVLKEDLENLIKLSNSIKSENEKITFDIKKDRIDVSLDNNGISLNNKIKISLEGQPIKINFNYKFLEETINYISSDSLNFKIVDEKTPIIIKGLGDDNFIFLTTLINDNN